jgi:hypothetical protein
MVQHDPIERREDGRRKGGLTEKREGKAWPSGENILGNKAGSNTTNAAAKTAGPLAGDGEGDALRISSLLLFRWGKSRRKKREAHKRGLSCEIFHENDLGFVGLLGPF